MYIALVAGVLFATACRVRGPMVRDVLVVATNNDAISLDPAVAYEFTSTAVCMDLYDTLIRYENSDYTKPLPSLAERWNASPDGLTWRFHLRAGLRFASGAPLDAEAVRWSLARTLTMKMAPAELITDVLAPESIRAVEPRVVEMRLQQPCSYFLSLLFNPAAAVLDRSVVAQHDDEWLRDHSAGSGPFVLKSWERDISMVLERNDRYWGEPPRLRRVIIKDVKESTTQKMMLERGDVDLAYDLNPIQIEDAMRRSPRVRALDVPFLRLYYLGMNAQWGPLKDPRVRQAIRCAIRYDELVGLARGHAIRLEGPIIKGLLGYAPHLDTFAYDPEKARTLLREAGYADGFDVELAASGGPTNFGPTREDICAKLQHDLGKVGIRVQIKTLSSTAYLDLYRGKKTQLNMGDWGADFPDAHNFAHPFGHSAGALARRVRYANAALDPIIDEAGREPRAERRAKLYVEAQTILMRDGPWAVLLQPQRILPVRAEVFDFHYDAQSPMGYASVWKAEP